MIRLPIVSDCKVSACSFNRNGCSAAAMTMGTDGCDTFADLGLKGGSGEGEAQVGACTRTDCVHNEHLECGAQAVTVGHDSAQCLTYAAA